VVKDNHSPNSPEDHRSPHGGFNEVYQELGCPKAEAQLSNEIDESRINDTATANHDARRYERRQDLESANYLQEELDRLAEEENEYWVMQVNNGDLEPVMYLSAEESLVDPDFDTEEGFTQSDYGSGFENHPEAIFEESDYSFKFSGLHYTHEVGEIGHTPRFEEFDGFNQEDRLQGAFIFPEVNQI